MNTTARTIRRVFAAGTAATAVFVFAACGTEVGPPTQDIGGSQEQQRETTPPIPPRTSPTRGDFGDEHGDAEAPRRDRSEGYDPIDRTQDWH